ncbi:MAG: response regulator transcription factor [Burkholderiales bacterium]|nr:response regulator transcription factor [Burkholderiales bacterium]
MDPLGTVTHARRALRVVIADDAPAMRRGFAELLGEIEGVAVIGDAADAPQAIDIVRRLVPDILVLDFRLPGGGGLAVLDALRDDARAPLSIVMTNDPDVEHRASCFAAGAGFFLDKSRQEGDLVELVAGLSRAHRQSGTRDHHSPG